ncbi:MAG TPA: hypothetical protein VGQ57_02535 [Polyangiaceae bacterium]|nr:hypothetical protein [Polyangiaceae bacterium]
MGTSRFGRSMGWALVASGVAVFVSACSGGTFSSEDAAKNALGNGGDGQAVATAGSAGNRGGDGTVVDGAAGRACSAPAGDSCENAARYCEGYAYVRGDMVRNRCSVNTGGCLSGRDMLFECIDSCQSEAPGSGSNNDVWKIADQCGGGGG